jgi:hypothetical protein
MPPNIKQQLWLYGAHSRAMHTPCIMVIYPSAVREVDSILGTKSREKWRLPTTFPRAGQHAAIEELGLKIPSIWEDYCGAAIRSWIQILNDEGVLGTTARTSLWMASNR